MKKKIVYWESIIIRKVLNIRGFHRSLKPQKLKSKEIQFFHRIATFSFLTHNIKNQLINGFCRNYENWCSQIEVLSHYICLKPEMEKSKEGSVQYISILYTTNYGMLDDYNI